MKDSGLLLLCVVLFLVSVYGLYRDVQAQAQARRPQPVTFWRGEPDCADKRKGRVLLEGWAYTESHEPVWVCGLGR